MAVRLVFLFDDPDPSHPLDDCFGVFGIQLELGREHHAARRACGRREPRASSRRGHEPGLDRVVNDGHTSDVLSDGSLPSAGIAAKARHRQCREFR